MLSLAYLTVLDAHPLDLIDVAALEPALAPGNRPGAKHPLVVCDDPDPGRLETNFAPLCDVVQRYQIGIALDPMSHVELRTPSQALALLDRVRKPNATLLIDALHLYRAGASPAELAEIEPSLFPYIHHCDAPAKAPPAAELRPGSRVLQTSRLRSGCRSPDCRTNPPRRQRGR